MKARLPDAHIRVWEHGDDKLLIMQWSGFLPMKC